MVDIIKLADIFNISVQDLVEKNLRIKNNNPADELDVLYSKAKDILNETEFDIIKHSMHRAIDRYEEQKNKGNG